jgi:hypothetical protein
MLFRASTEVRVRIEETLLACVSPMLYDAWFRGKYVHSRLMTCSDTTNSGESLDSAAMEDTDKSRVYRLWIAVLVSDAIDG